jgi:5-methylcytosine-specific restriction endonuclease McrA
VPSRSHRGEPLALPSSATSTTSGRWSLSFAQSAYDREPRRATIRVLAAARVSRKPLAYALQVRVFRRDGWLCRWCHRPVVFAPALRVLDQLARDRGHVGPLAYHDPRWRRDRAPLLDHLAAVVDHVEAFSLGGAHDETNFVTACNKCNARKNNIAVTEFQQAAPAQAVKGKGKVRRAQTLGRLLDTLRPARARKIRRVAVGEGLARGVDSRAVTEGGAPGAKACVRASGTACRPRCARSSHRSWSSPRAGRLRVAPSTHGQPGAQHDP